MRGYILSGTGPGAGRTTVGCALAFAFKVRGLRVGVMKPVATGCVECNGAIAADDATALIAAASSDLPLDLAAPYRYRSPLAPLDAARADGLAAPDFARIDRALREIESRSDIVIVEDTHEMAAKIDASHDFADLATARELELILVVGRRAGFIDAAKDALEFAATRGSRYVARSSMRSIARPVPRSRRTQRRSRSRRAFASSARCASRSRSASRSSSNCSKRSGDC